VITTECPFGGQVRLTVARSVGQGQPGFSSGCRDDRKLMMWNKTKARRSYRGARLQLLCANSVPDSGGQTLKTFGLVAHSSITYPGC